MTEKELYRQLCQQEKTIPIFSRDWWLDAVCGEDNWDIILVEKRGTVVGAMPYYIRKKCIFDSICMPPLTQKMGPWIKYPENQSYTKRLSYDKDIMDEFVQRIPAVDFFNQNFDYSITNWLPFYWRGFTATTRYTYVVEDLSDVGNIDATFSHGKREDIRKALKSGVKVKFDLPATDFYRHHSDALKKQNVYPKDISYSFDLFEKIYNACYSHNAGKVIYAEDDAGNIHAGLFVIWDECSAYHLINIIEPKYRKYGSATLLFREIMKYVADKTEKFDFEGSMIKGAEGSYRAFGTRQKPYFHVSKQFTQRYKVCFTARELIRSIINGQ